MRHHDAIGIGAGQSGRALARRLVAAGQKVAVIAGKFFGGTCVNTACTLTKSLVASAYAAHLARRAGGYDSGSRSCERWELSVHLLRRSHGKKMSGLPHGRPWPGAFATLLCAVALLAPAVAGARDLVVYGEPTLEKPLKSVGSVWQARTGTRVNIFVAPTDLSYAQIDRGARCDVIFALAGAATEEAARNNIIHAATVDSVLRNSLVLISTETSVQSDKDASPADLARLIAGKRLAIANPDRDAAGDYAADLLRKIGIVIDGRNKATVVAESTAGVVDMLATGKAQLGIVYATDATAGFKAVARLPVPDRPPLDYVMAQARDPASDTRPFIAFLKSAEARAAFESAGLTSIAASNDAADAGRQQ